MKNMMPLGLVLGVLISSLSFATEQLHPRGVGFAAPVIDGSTNVPNPEPAAIIYDSNAGQFMGNFAAAYGTTNWQPFASAAPVAPTVQKFTSGGTYTLPSSPKPLYIRVRMVGGKGGDTSFGGSLLVAGGGFGGGQGDTVAPGLGGTATIGTGPVGTAVAGGLGGGAGAVTTGAGLPGGIGGSSPFGGAGSGNDNSAGSSAVANSGSGGGGGSVTESQFGGGGASGGYIDVIISGATLNGFVGSPQTVTIGAGGSGGTAGSGHAGGDGGSGYVIVEEHYQ